MILNSSLKQIINDKIKMIKQKELTKQEKKVYRINVSLKKIMNISKIEWSEKIYHES